MNVLLLTGMLAEGIVRRYALEAGKNIDVLVLPVSVAAFITPEFAVKNLKDRNFKDYDLVLLPGSVHGDVSPVQVATGVPTFKGPVHAADIPSVLSCLGEIELSKVIPASELIGDQLRRRAHALIQEVEDHWESVMEKGGGFVIGKDGHRVPIGSSFPMRIIAEIVNAPSLSKTAIEKRARYYERWGADIIDIGMIAGKPDKEDVKRIIDTVRSSTDLPISIDSLDSTEIEAAAEAEVDLILSLDAGNLDEVGPSLAHIPSVILPSNMREGLLPKVAEDRVSALMSNMMKARDLGLSKIIADLILEPVITPGLLESLRAYQLFRRLDTTTPVLFGVGNVSELIDVDSQGVNALLTALACEVGASLLFIPESSVKAKGSVEETATASKMMFIAKQMSTVPKDLGVDLLRLKEKRWTEEPYNSGVETDAQVVCAKADEELQEDESGWFRIQIDREMGNIIAIHSLPKRDAPDIVIKGREAKKIYQTIIRMGLVSRLDHSAYLGRELSKAETALRVGRSYTQDEDLFH